MPHSASLSVTSTALQNKIDIASHSFVCSTQEFLIFIQKGSLPTTYVTLFEKIVIVISEIINYSN